ncbi:MAG: hypothetical protein JWO19_3973 [Bryobacterales bacterium]|nr:hypothetical protein [Bryobacterales bacterium]
MIRNGFACKKLNQAAKPGARCDPPLQKSGCGMLQAPSHSTVWRPVRANGYPRASGARDGITLLPGARPESLHVLEGLFILQTDFVDQLCVDDDALL